MKLPPYIAEERKKEIAEVIHKLRILQGDTNAQLLKKIILVATYGTMLNGKISFNDFIGQIKRWVDKEKPIEKFWNFKYKANFTNDKFFCIPYRLVYNGNITQVENEIINLFYGMMEEHIGSKTMLVTRDNIKPSFSKDIKKIFQSI